MNQGIFKRLKELQKNTYSKYSNYKVTAIVKTDVGEFNGVNVENASFTLTLCAERSAIVSAITAGAKKVLELYLLTENENEFGTPCGACRQVMLEFMNKDSKVFVFNMKGQFKEFKLEQLIPFAWDNTLLN